MRKITAEVKINFELFNKRIPNQRCDTFSSEQNIHGYQEDLFKTYGQVDDWSGFRLSR